MPFSRIYNQRMGIVRRMERRFLPAHMPPEIVCIVAQLADTTRFCAWPSDPTTTGCVWWDATVAQHAALGEAVERYCGNLVPGNLLYADFTDCIAAGYTALDPAAIPLFTDEQYWRAGFPFTRLTDTSPIHWVAGQEMATGTACLVPATLVYVTYPRIDGPTHTELLTNPPMVAGIAAGPSQEAAECAALEELIERDAVMVAWLTQTPLPRIRVPDDMAALLCGPAGMLEITAVLFPNPYGLPVLGAFVHDATTGIITLGTACRPTPHEALRKAYAEAIQLQLVARTLDDPQSMLMQTAQHRQGPLKPWRSDRAYCQSYRADWSDVTDLLCQLQLYLDPTMRRYLDAWLIPASTIQIDEIASAPERSRRIYLERLLAQGISPIAVDVTTCDIAPLELAVVRVVAPGMCLNTPTAFPLLGALRPAAHDAYAVAMKAPPLPYA
jgi:ribosomal protein S12 methylthiotransferase accessory factor